MRLSESEIKEVERGYIEEFEQLCDSSDMCEFANRCVDLAFRKLSELSLTEPEMRFVLCVYRSPRSKLNSGEAWHNTDDQSTALWKNPEKLGLIEAVGSYKWIPTEKLTSLIENAALGVASPESQMLRNLLAQIHRDGGHYTEQHGIEKSVSDAILIVAGHNARRDAAPVPAPAKQEADYCTESNCRRCNTPEELRTPNMAHAGIGETPRLALTGDRITDDKATHLLKQGYVVTGYVLSTPNGGRGIVEHSAVRWLDKDEMWTLMNPPGLCTYVQLPDHLVERLQFHMDDVRNTAFARSTMREVVEYTTKGTKT